jgi:hypothetical protein
MIGIWYEYVYCILQMLVMLGNCNAALYAMYQKPKLTFAKKPDQFASKDISAPPKNENALNACPFKQIKQRHAQIELL